jgi:TRAP-type mannitol/chloroaromatic compound transport system permease small subunit
MKNPINRTDLWLFLVLASAFESVFNQLFNISPEFQLGAQAGQHYRIIFLISITMRQDNKTHGRIEIDFQGEHYGE